MALLYQHCRTDCSKQITYKLAFVRKNLIILRFDYDSAHVIIWNNYAGKKKNKVLDTIIMPIIQNNFLSEFENDQFLKSICTFATCQKEQYTLASNCPVFSCPSWKNQNNIHNLISINALKKYGQYFKQNCFIFFFEFENCYEYWRNVSKPIAQHFGQQSDKHNQLTYRPTLDRPI